MDRSSRYKITGLKQHIRPMNLVDIDHSIPKQQNIHSSARGTFPVLHCLLDFAQTHVH